MTKLIHSFIILASLLTISCQTKHSQTKDASKAAKETSGAKDNFRDLSKEAAKEISYIREVKATSVGLACGSGDFTDANFGFGSRQSSATQLTESVYDSDSMIVWEYPARQMWSCKDHKWFRDFAGEKKRDAHEKVVKAVREAITERRLTSAEMGLMDEATDLRFSSFAGFTADSCEQSSTKTATLIAQLSFWPHTEEELPLEEMESYVKGLQCGAGTQRAYEIMNERIEKWLKSRYPKGSN